MNKGKYHHAVPNVQPAPWRPTHPLDIYHGDHDIARLQREYPVGAKVVCIRLMDEPEFAGTSPLFTVGKEYRVTAHQRGQKRIQYPSQRAPNPSPTDASVTLTNDRGTPHDFDRAWLLSYFSAAGFVPSAAAGQHAGLLDAIKAHAATQAAPAAASTKESA